MALEKSGMRIEKVSDFIYEIPVTEKKGMQVPARIYSSPKLFNELDEGVFNQITNVATLSGIQEYAFCMPDGHWGYGFPIGGVAAFDRKEGIISPGGIGFDINCLSGNTKILHEFGYFKEISEFDEDWQQQSIKCLDVGKKLESTKIVRFIKTKPKNKVYKLKTETGKEIVVTAEHPVLTPIGMFESEKIYIDDLVAINSFEGIKFENPSEEILVSETDLKKIYPGSKKGFYQITKFLKEKNLLPLKMNNPNMPYLIKIMGFIQGNGNLGFLKKNPTATNISFYGKEEDLKLIKKDFEKLGFGLSLFSRHRKHSIQTSYDLIEFEAMKHSAHSSSSALGFLLKALGVVVGNKVEKEFEIPKWLFNSPLWMKRLFLAAFFGAELSSPKILTGHKFTFYFPTLSMNKRKELVLNARIFLNQIKKLLAEFEVESNLIVERKEFVNKHGKISIRLRLQVSETNENLIKFYSTIGFEYNLRKQFLGNLAVHYLKIKENVLNERNQSIEKTVSMYQSGMKLKQIVKEVGSGNINERFIARSLWQGRKTSPRIAFNFDSFNEFVKNRTIGLGEVGQSWDKIISKEEIQFNDFVYDFTVENSNHNFIANSIVSSNCGMRLLTTNLSFKEVQPKLHELVNELFERVPVGVGRKGFVKLSSKDFDELMVDGVKWCVEKSLAWQEDVKATESHGAIPLANSEKVSQKAKLRGIDQLGTLGSGNHYLEIQVVKKENIFDEEIAKAFGIFPEQIVVMLHCGSRGFGHQIASEYLDKFLSVMPSYGIKIPDPQLACAPFESKEGQDYFQAMACAANMAFANRQVIAHRIREVFSKVFHKSAEELEMNLVYDVAHNIAKLEKHKIKGQVKELIVHRKGATRSFPPAHEELWGKYNSFGQPVIIGGSMETGSYLLVGTESASQTFYSTAHGSGRTMSRVKAKKLVEGKKLQKEMERKGIFVKTVSYSGLAEEAGLAYKDINEVIEAVHEAGLSKKVVSFKPIGNIKG